jgi:heme-degrading monooxygenase HmoA
MAGYTVGIWTVKPGREDEFVAAWSEMGARTLDQFPHAHGTLLRRQDKPNTFVSFGPWRDPDEIQAWRASAAFQDGLRAMRDLLESFEPGVYELVTEISASPGPGR